MRHVRLLVGLLALLVAPLGSASAAGPSLTVVAPKNGAAITGKTVTVTFTTTDIRLVTTTVPVSEAGKHPEANKPGEGHLHFLLDLQPLVIWEKADPYTFTDVPAGDHQLMVELVQNDHSSFSPRVMQIIHFTASGAQPAPTAMPATGASEGDSWLALFVLAAILLIAGGVSLRRERST